MKYLLALFAVILTVSAMPADVDRQIDLDKDEEFSVIPPYLDGEIDLSRQPDAFDTNPNFTDARIPFGQLGFAATGGGTRGGNGGSHWTVWDGWALRDAVRGNDNRVVTVRGRIDLFALFSNSPGVRIDVGGYKTIVGADRNAMIFGGGLRIGNVRQVIVDNLRIHNALSFAQGERPNGNGGIINQVAGPFSEIDGIEITGSHHVWIHHCEFADDPWIADNTPGDRRRHDGSLDIVRGSNYISISNSIFRNHNMITLVGNGEGMGAVDRGRLKVTFYHNWYQGVTQRMPLVRFGEVHVVNNLFTDIRSYGIGVGVEAQVIAERNVFINTRNSWVWAAPNNAIPNPLGFLRADNNRLVNSGHESAITANGVNWRPAQYYTYNALDVNVVEAWVRRNAGPR